MSPEHGWELRYDPRVRKQLQRILSKTVIQRIEEAANSLRSKPLSGKPVHNHPEVRSKRVTTSGGEYRIIYLPIKEDRGGLVILVATRQEVYKLLDQKASRSGLGNRRCTTDPAEGAEDPNNIPSQPCGPELRLRTG